MLKIKKHISSFFLLWLTVVTISIGVAILLASLLGEFLYNRNGMSYSASNDGFLGDILSLIILIGLFMGLGQWIVISTKIKKAYNWILATLVGFSVGSFFSFIIFSIVGEMLPIPNKHYIIIELIQMMGSLMGAGMFTGACQWVSLKRKLAHSLKWSLVSGLSFVIGILPMFFVQGYTVNYPIVRVISIIVSVGLVAIISGYFAEPLIIHPKIETFTQQETAI
ncbi:MAG: hypothetical protein K8S20_15130 [Chloroflexi bacterium]|nr:hypothetical protein [Chloroflexota bacterium]